MASASFLQNFEGFDPVSMGQGSNQFMSFPQMNNTSQKTNFTGFDPASSGAGVAPTPPGIVPPQSGYNIPPSVPSGSPWYPPSIGMNPIGGIGKVGNAAMTTPTTDPQLTQELAAYLQSQVGQGVKPFDLSALLPSTGQATTPGSLTAPLNPLMQQLLDFYQGKGAGVTGTAGGGGPLSYVLPMWQSEIQSMNIPIQQQLANLKEQFGSLGLSGSSAAANALENYAQQTATGQESLLGQLTMEALPQEMQMAGGLQAVDQASIDRLLQEFERTSPQNNPLLNEIYGLSTTFPPVMNKKGNASAGLAGGLADLLPGIAGSVGQGLSGGGGITDVFSSLAGMFIA